MAIKPLLLLLVFQSPLWCLAQSGLQFDPSVPVQRAGVPLTMPWAGGLNSPQVSTIDLDQDGLQDIFLLDRSGDKPIFLLNTGTPGQPAYRASHAYDDVHPFPLLHDWALLRDYNCDGKVDIFAYTSGAFAVYKNTSDASGLSFTLVDDQVGSNYVPTISPNLYISNVDIPGIVDMDGDGDLDILTFSIWGANYLEFHKNLSMELYGTCDSLVYEVRSRCWGGFQESVSGNSITLNMPCSDNVPNPELPIHGEEGTAPSDRAHSGSTVLPLDLDGDGDMDLLLGDYQSPDLTGLINGGTLAHALMISTDTLFPAYDQRIYFDQFLAPYFVDIDGDGERDLVVTPNSTSGAENTRGTWYYRNTGTDAAPHFNFQRNDLFQGEMLDFGEGSRPVLFDYNGDGLMDLVVANEGYYVSGGMYSGKLALLENTGTSSSPSFNLVTDDYAQLSGMGFGTGMHPAFGDVDGDGHPDMIIGEGGGNDPGTLHFFRNISSGPVAQFQLTQALMTDDNGAVIDVGANATPQLFDLNDDGLPDLIVGERNGNLNYYRNVGTAQIPSWHLESQALGGVRVNEYWSSTGYSVPYLFTDGQGHKQMISGSEAGGIHLYDGITGDGTGTWNLADSIWGGLREGLRTAVVLYDFTGDGQLDAVIGNYRGGLSFWSSGIWTGVDAPSSGIAGNGFSIAPNPANGSVDILMHTPVVSNMQVQLFDGLGRSVRMLPVERPQMHMDLGDLAPGLYTMRLISGNGHWTNRLVIAH